MIQHDLQDTLIENRLVAILRAADASRFADAATVLHAAGVRVLEAALTTPGATDAIATIRKKLGDDAHIGAGSVREVSDVDKAADAGATFLVTPTVNPLVMERAHERGLPVICGALTPTEIDQAWRLGAAAVKVFPIAAVGGIAYLRAIRAPMPDIPLVPTGGVHLAEVAKYLESGSIAVAAATPLLGDALTSSGSLADLATRASEFVAAAAKYVSRT
ncbi:bifunctional 4-hydroxy-2-oxoglutarate aldolase/2-dehydro-3-deoxy-phosphogluconate aldolase [Amycolatopsis sp. EV170708-02-1]|uniref:bifunctional 4-hydroxy-2-oxoglutarate aldolase/2-dehydro-3-deoxy-phosphogluconate aldolase n=1 Tax=Amycolatopsis sp. EV170708-02-1 TaxID=2919322 RepID=UPI001F0CD4C1|nr:bifunctional 4-hydroxy-2-oxoglutarate aldolase/2-dehydro-3-deoxy-phosphogluconate aldolase [Amycolatopsis sp. EV170708-02-1]UMP06426.1 bifunctional 4-hydroxy-2-oxoglutarate aldolase/2-dehydro-3-deoxy-phosphogluconate aldolase [Amycolatopsis sp. EV170708-02-1]